MNINDELYYLETSKMFQRRDANKIQAEKTIKKREKRYDRRIQNFLKDLTLICTVGASAAAGNVFGNVAVILIDLVCFSILAFKLGRFTNKG